MDKNLLASVSDRLQREENRGYKKKYAHPDLNTGEPLIGYGHLMTGGKEDRAKFKKLFGNEVNYDRVRSGKDPLPQKYGRKLLEETIVEKTSGAAKMFPGKWDSFSPRLQESLIDSHYRGNLSHSKKTRKLLNEGKYLAASKEFLNHEEYKTSRARGMSGVAKRMEKTAAAMAEEPVAPTGMRASAKSVRPNRINRLVQHAINAYTPGMKVVKGAYNIAKGFKEGLAKQIDEGWDSAGKIVAARGGRSGIRPTAKDYANTALLATEAMGLGSAWAPKGANVLNAGLATSVKNVRNLPPDLAKMTPKAKRLLKDKLETGLVNIGRKKLANLAEVRWADPGEIGRAFGQLSQPWPSAKGSAKILYDGKNLLDDFKAGIDPAFQSAERFADKAANTQYHEFTHLGNHFPGNAEVLYKGRFIPERQAALGIRKTSQELKELQQLLPRQNLADDAMYAGYYAKPSEIQARAVGKLATPNDANFDDIYLETLTNTLNLPHFTSKSPFAKSTIKAMPGLKGGLYTDYDYLKNFVKDDLVNKTPLENMLNTRKLQERVMHGQR